MAGSVLGGALGAGLCDSFCLSSFDDLASSYVVCDNACGTDSDCLLTESCTSFSCTTNPVSSPRTRSWRCARGRGLLAPHVHASTAGAAGLPVLTLALPACACASMWVGWGCSKTCTTSSTCPGSQMCVSGRCTSEFGAAGQSRHHPPPSQRWLSLAVQARIAPALHAHNAP